MPAINLSDAELLALRWLLSKCDILDGDLRQNCPFVYHFSESALKSLGGGITNEEIPGDGLWTHPVAEEFYDKKEECECCGSYVNKESLKELDGDKMCEECYKGNADALMRAPGRSDIKPMHPNELPGMYND